MPDPLYRALNARSSGCGSGAEACSRLGRGRTAEGRAALLEVADLGRVGAGVAVGDQTVLEGAVGDREAEQLAHALELVDRQLLHLVVGVLGLEALAERVALDRLGQDHGRRALVLDRRPVRRVDLAGLVAAARGVETLGDLRVGEQFRQLDEGGLGAEEVLADVGDVAGGVRLELRVRDLAQPAQQRTLGVQLEQLVPGVAPERLDDVPAGLRNCASSSWTTRKLARTGPSRRCRLQLMTKVRLSSCSRAASARAAVDSGSSISPSPRKAQTCELAVSLMERLAR